MIMGDNLTQAAQQGDINALYVAIGTDPFILDKIDAIPFVDTPFHIAAAAGKTHFALEIMMLKPSLARKLNKNGYTPMHLASINGHEQLMRGLLSKDRDLFRVSGKAGKTPLHCMVTTGANTTVLREMLCACPGSIKELTVRRETALHLAVKNNQFEAFEVLVDCVKKFHKEEVYRWKDEEGFTVLHHAIIRSQMEMIKLLFRRYRFMEWNLGVEVRDDKDRTALDIIKEFRAEDVYRESIRGVLISSDILLNRVTEGAYFKSVWKRSWSYTIHSLLLAVREVPTDSRDALLVVLALVITTLFQVGVNPPGGFWQDDGVTNGKQYFAGTPILATTNPVLYQIISFFTMAGFATSLNLTLLLTIEMPMKYLLLVALTFLSNSYLFAYLATTRKFGVGVIITTYGAVALFVAIIILIYLWKYLKPIILIPVRLGGIRGST